MIRKLLQSVLCICLAPLLAAQQLPATVESSDATQGAAPASPQTTAHASPESVTMSVLGSSSSSMIWKLNWSPMFSRYLSSIALTRLVVLSAATALVSAAGDEAGKTAGSNKPSRSQVLAKTGVSRRKNKQRRRFISDDRSVAGRRGFACIRRWESWTSALSAGKSSRASAG